MYDDSKKLADIHSGRNNNDILKLLGGCGGTVDINHPESSRSSICPTPLHTAARLGRVENGRALLELGADYNKRNGAGQTALHIAAGHEISGER